MADLPGTCEPAVEGGSEAGAERAPAAAFAVPGAHGMVFAAAVQSTL